MWSLNPRAREAFSGMAWGAPVLLGIVAGACALAGIGLWRRAIWGHRLAVLLLAANLAGDVINFALGTERRAVFGIPVVVALLALLFSRRARSVFEQVP